MDDFIRKVIDSNDIFAQDGNIVVDDAEYEDGDGVKTKGLKLSENLSFENVHIKGTLDVDGKSTFNDNAIFNKDAKTENGAHFVDNGNIVVSEIEESIEAVEPERETKNDYNLYGVVDVDKDQTKLKFYYSKFAPLNKNNIIPSEFLPSYVDDIIEVSSFYKTDSTEIPKEDDSSIKGLFSGVGDDGTVFTKSKGESGRIYIYNKANGSLSENQVSIYRWSGSQFVEIADFDALEKWCKENLVSTSVIENSNGTISFILKNTNGSNRGSIVFKATNGTNLLYDTNKNQITINTEYNGDNWIKVDNIKKEIAHKEHSETTETIESSNTNSGLGPNSTINIPSISFDSKGHKSGNSSKTLKLIGDATEASDGFMSKEDKKKINGIVSGANYYEAKLVLSNSSSGTTLVKSDSNAYINFVESYQNPNDIAKTIDKIDTSIGILGGKNISIVGTLDGDKGVITFNGYDTTIKSGTNSVPTGDTVNVVSTINSNNNGFNREYTYNTSTVPTSNGVKKLIGEVDYIDNITTSGNKIVYSKKVSTNPVDIITFKGENGINASISNGILSIKHSNTAITAGNDGVSFTAITPDTSSIVLPYVSYDAYGHITGKGNKTVTLSDFANKSSLSDYAKKIDLNNYNYYDADLVIADSSTGTLNKTTSTEPTYLNLVETDKDGNKTVSKSVNLVGSGKAKVTSDGSQIVISATSNEDTNTLYSLTVGDGQSISNKKTPINPRLQLVADEKTLTTAIPVVGSSWINTFSNGNTDISIVHKKLEDVGEKADTSFVKVGVDDYGHVISTEPVTSVDLLTYVQPLIPEYSIVENPEHIGYYYLTDGTSQLGKEFKVNDKNLTIKADGTNALTYNGDNEASLNIVGSGDILVSSQQGVITIKGTDTKYSLPIASSTKLGGVKIGSNINIGTDGTISVDKAAVYTGSEGDFGTIDVTDGNISLSSAVGRKGSANGSEVFNDYENNIASGDSSHAEGYRTQALGVMSHTEGSRTIVTAKSAEGHAEGYLTKVNGWTGAHAEGSKTEANGVTSHAEGHESIANGRYSHAQNNGTIASGESQTTIGKYNIEDTNNTYSFIIGNGTSDDDRHNVLTADWNGVMTSYGSTSDFVLDNEDGSKISLRGVVAAQEKANVSYTPLYTSGTEIGRITINNVISSIYVPTEDVGVTSVNYNSTLEDTNKTIIGNIIVNKTAKYNVLIPKTSSTALYKNDSGLSIGSTTYGDTTTEYCVPYATSTTYGVVKPGTNVSIRNGVINATDSKYKIALTGGHQISLINSNDDSIVTTVTLPETEMKDFKILDSNGEIVYNGKEAKTLQLMNNLTLKEGRYLYATNTEYSLEREGNTYSLLEDHRINSGSFTIPTTLSNPNSLKIKKDDTVLTYNGDLEQVITLSNNLKLSKETDSNSYNLSAINTTYNMKATTNGYGLYDDSGVMKGDEIIIPTATNYSIKKSTNGYGLYDGAGNMKGSEVVIPDVGVTSIKNADTRYGTIGVSTNGHTTTLSVSGSPISASNDLIKLSTSMSDGDPRVVFGPNNTIKYEDGRRYNIRLYSLHDLLRHMYDVIYALYQKAGFDMENIPGRFFTMYDENQSLQNLQQAISGGLFKI